MMNADRVSRQAIRAAQRKARKTGHKLTREELLKLRVQTAKPWHRILVVAFGLAVGFGTFVIYTKGAPIWIWLPFSICALILTMCGVFGRKAYLERELKKMSEQAPTRIVDAIINAL